MPSLSEKMSQHIQISIRDIGIAVIDDIARNDLFYISISKSNEIWTETRKSYVKPLSSELNHQLDEHYKSYIKHLHDHPNDEELAKKKYRIDNHRVRPIRLTYKKFYESIDYYRMFHLMRIRQN